MEEMATQAEEAANKSEPGKLYKITNGTCAKFHSAAVGPVKDKSGKLLSTAREQDAWWTKHFWQLLNRPAPEELPEIQESE